MALPQISCSPGVGWWRKAARPRPAAGKRSCRLLIIGLCRTKFANFIGSSARRRWKRRSSKRPSNTSKKQLRLPEIAPELTGHGLPLSKCEAYNRVYDQFYRSEIAPELTGHGLPLSKCEAYNRVYDQFYQSEIAPELTGHGLPLSKCEAYNRVYDQFYQ